MTRAKKTKVAYSSVSLPVPLMNKIKETIKGTGYASVGSFVEDLVRTALTLKKEEAFAPETKLSEETEKRIKERLKSLGYLS